MTNPGDDYRGLGTPAGPDLGWAAPPPPRPIVGQSSGPPTFPRRLRFSHRTGLRSRRRDRNAAAPGSPACSPPPSWPAGCPERASGLRSTKAPSPARPSCRSAGPGSRSNAPAGSTEAAAQGILPSVVQVRTGQGSGSGVVMDDQGHVLTNHHVVAGSSTVSLVLSTGRRVTADVIGSNRDNDIAVLQARSGDLPAARLGVSTDLRIGQSVIAVGSPLGLTGTVTSGVISALDRRGTAESMIQTDASINPGNSGGPLVDLDGRVVGINTSIATLGGRGAGNIGIGFAVPIDRAAEVAQQILTRG